ncbi:MAG: K(+)-transporting ATPase subunit F [Acidobacteriota bacterium]|nr:K(+)-transporting ATPase subunit F [Acidobacteriota bacterium]
MNGSDAALLLITLLLLGYLFYALLRAEDF